MLALTGLPTLFPKLVEGADVSERMFHIVFLNPLNEADTARGDPQTDSKRKLSSRFFGRINQNHLVNHKRGYPYFVQYVCREVFDVWVQAIDAGHPPPHIPVKEIIRKLDSDFFAGRWAKATDRQRELLGIVASLANCDSEFTVQEVVGSGANENLERHSAVVTSTKCLHHFPTPA